MRILNLFSTLFVCLLLFSCSNDDSSESTENESPEIEDLNAVTQITDQEGNLYEVGFNQVSNINQDPFVRKTNAAGETIWYVEHEKTDVDGRAYLIDLDEDQNPYVVFSLVGGSNSDDYITKRVVTSNTAFQNVYEPSYANGGGPKVSVIARLNPNSGEIEKGSFVIARKNNGQTNGFKIKNLGFVENSVAFNAETAAWPPTVGTSYVRFPDITDEDRINNIFEMYYEMNLDFTEIITANLVIE